MSLISFLAAGAAITGKSGPHTRNPTLGTETRVGDSHHPQQLDHDTHRDEAVGALESSTPPLAQIVGELVALRAEVRELRDARGVSILPPPEYLSERGDDGPG
jgi:hypothetical protein